MFAFVLRNPVTCIFMIIGAIMNVGSKINDAYTFVNAGLPHQVYEALGALVFFASVTFLLYQWDKERQAATTKIPSKGRAYTPAELNEIASRRPITGLDVVKRIEKLEAELPANVAARPEPAEPASSMPNAAVVTPARYSKAQINKIVAAVDAIYPSMQELETALTYGEGIVGSLEAIIQHSGASALLERLDTLRLQMNDASGHFERAREQNSLYDEACRIVAHKHNYHHPFFEAYNDLVGILRDIPDKMSAPAVRNYVDAKKATFATRVKNYLAWAKETKGALRQYRDYYQRHSTTD